MRSFVGAIDQGTSRWRGTEELKRNWGESRRWEPHMPAAQREQLYSAWHKAVARSFGWKST
jgi:glycerol kinase